MIPACISPGTATQLNPGDLILIVGDERSYPPTNENWDVRAVATVTVDGPNNRTYVTWNEGLGDGGVVPPATIRSSMPSGSARRSSGTTRSSPFFSAQIS